MHIKFKGSAGNPLKDECTAIDEANWNVFYNRRLIRDVRTVSGGVMVITASAIGNEILFEAQPTDHSLYKKEVSNLCLSCCVKYQCFISF